MSLRLVPEMPSEEPIPPKPYFDLTLQGEFHPAVFEDLCEGFLATGKNQQTINVNGGNQPNYAGVGTIYLIGSLSISGDDDISFYNDGNSGDTFTEVRFTPTHLVGLRHINSRTIDREGTYTEAPVAQLQLRGIGSLILGKHPVKDLVSRLHIASNNEQEMPTFTWKNNNRLLLEDYIK